MTESTAQPMSACGVQGRVLAVRAVLAGVLLLSSVGVTSVPAQKRGRPPRRPAADTLPILQTPLVEIAPAVAVRLNVQADVDTTIRLGLAPGGVTLVEFPAGDMVYAYFPGDENYVTLDAGLLERAKPTDPLVFRPGVGFAQPAPESGQPRPYGQITVQMVSGLVFTFHVYPVTSLTVSASRVALSYDVAEVVRLRQSQGWPTNLHLRSVSAAPLGEPPPPPVPSPGPEMLPVATPTPAATPAPPPTPAQEAFVLAATGVPRPGDAPLRWHFAKAVHGLAVAVQPSVWLTQGTWQRDVVAVKNTLKQPLKLVNLPQLIIETRTAAKKSGAPINAEAWPVLGLAHTLPAGELLEPGQTYYFSLVSRPPVLGVAQFLRVQVAHTNAADAPASLPLRESAR